jgi:hypothetical protein
MNHTLNHDVESSVRFRPSPPSDEQRGSANQCNGIVKIPLTRGLFATIDAADFERVSQFKWQAMNSRDVFYAVNTGKVMMHRFILGLTPNDPEVDHRNRNGLDNRRENLRLATRSQQMANRRLFTQTSTGYKGVARRGAKFAAYIGARRMYLGLFPTAEAAALAYDAKAVELFGEFACLNLPAGLQKNFPSDTFFTPLTTEPRRAA